VHEVVGEARRDVDVAAADAGTNTVLWVCRGIGVGGAPGVVGVREAAAFPASGVDQGVAAQDVELVAGVGDAVHALPVEVEVAGRVAGEGSVGVEALPRHRQPHPGLRPRRHEQFQHLDCVVLAAAGRPSQHRHAGDARADAVDLEARPEAAGADAEWVRYGHASTALLAPRLHVDDALRHGYCRCKQQHWWQ